jgi:hypothetical protein
MATPQQPELARNKRSPASEESAKAAPVESPPPSTASRTVPPDNQPGHHPPVEQDKPRQPPKLPRRHHRFAFRREGLLPLASGVVGVRAASTWVDATDDHLEIGFGPWHLETPMANVASAEITGPYRWWKVIGPPHLSLRDRGITFATATSRGVCIRFKEPVAAALPTDALRHPSATVTVDDPEDLVRFIEQSGARPDTSRPSAPR